MSTPSADLLTPLELCAALKISRRTYARLVACGLPPAVTVCSRRRFRLPDVEAWLRQRTRPMTAAAGRTRLRPVHEDELVRELKRMARGGR